MTPCYNPSRMKTGVTNERIMSYLVEMHELVIDMNKRMVTKEDLADMLKEYPTKNDLERMKDEIIEPVIKAVDKDAEIVYTHGKRITALERRSGQRFNR
jgi:hypothetical protein